MSFPDRSPSRHDSARLQGGTRPLVRAVAAKKNATASSLCRHRPLPRFARQEVESVVKRVDTEVVESDPPEMRQVLTIARLGIG